MDDRSVHADDYCFFLALATLITGIGLFYAFVRDYFLLQDVLGGKVLPPANFEKRIEHGSNYALFAQLFCWATIFAIKFSFLIYFRVLVRKLPFFEAWWWFILAFFIPSAIVTVPGSFIMCPHTSPSVICKICRLPQEDVPALMLR